MTAQHREAVKRDLADLGKMQAQGDSMTAQIHKSATARLAAVQQRLTEPRGDDYEELIMERGQLNQVLAGGQSTR